MGVPRVCVCLGSSRIGKHQIVEEVLGHPGWHKHPNYIGIKTEQTHQPGLTRSQVSVFRQAPNFPSLQCQVLCLCPSLHCRFFVVSLASTSLSTRPSVWKASPAGHLPGTVKVLCSEHLWTIWSIQFQGIQVSKSLHISIASRLMYNFR